jgi:glutamate synthase domain-containing protein 3
MATFDLAACPLRELNAELHRQAAIVREGGAAEQQWEILNPRGSHAVAVGVDAPLEITVRGNVGYYCGGMNQSGTIRIEGSAGPGLGENMMSGTISVSGNASQYAGATGRGGLLVINGNASSRCGISMKGIDILVRGNVGHMSAFLAQAGNLVVLGDAGDSLGDSIYEARVFVLGQVKSLGADCIKKEMRKEHIELLESLLTQAGISDMKASDFTRYGSARELYHFDVDRFDAY